MDTEAHERLELCEKIGFRDVERIKCCANCRHARLHLTTDYMKYLDVRDANPTVFDSDIECKCNIHNIGTIINPNYVVCNDYE